jgi:hypothetical protein
MDRLGPDPAAWPPNRMSTHYDVVHPDPAKRWRLPPKLVLSVAAGIATGEELPPKRFHGGREANSCLRKLDFEILDRRKP